MASTSNTTTDHNEIKNWVIRRGGKPAKVRQIGIGDSALLRIDFPGYSGGDSLVELSWEEFFQIFEKNNLRFVHQDETIGGRESRFNKFIAG